jgi:nucleotide-binding universal stress UspA family protein
MTPRERPRQVVVAYDFSPSADSALALAITTAAREPIHVLHILAALDPQHGLPVAPVNQVDYAYAELIQHRLADRVRDAFSGHEVPSEIHFFVHARIGPPAGEILALAEEVSAHLILIGSHGRTGLDRLVLGSVSERVVREARCPVLVARPHTYPRVELLDIVDVDHPHARYVKPHRYSYTDQRVQLRPADWPLS